MKHAMAVKLLAAAAFALGGAAIAQPDNGAATTPAEQGTQDTRTGTMPSSAGSNATGSDSSYGTDAATPGHAMTREQKKQSLANIKKVVLGAGSDQGRLSGQQGTGSESGATGMVQHLKVFRRGDKVILRGTVRSQEDKDRAGRAAEGAAMGEPIVNELKVK